MKPCIMTGSQICHHSGKVCLGAQSSLLPGSQYAYGNVLHQRVDTDDQFWRILCVCLTNMTAHPCGGGSGHGNVDQSRLSGSEGHSPEEGILHHEGVCLRELVERPWCVIGPEIDNFNSILVTKTVIKALFDGLCTGSVASSCVRHEDEDALLLFGFVFFGVLVVIGGTGAEGPARGGFGDAATAEKGRHAATCAYA